MITNDILTRIKEIEIQTRRLLNGMLVGDSTSAIKGTGFEFDQIREYSQGDDVRFIDWHSSARMNNLLVKQFMEERSRTIILAVDCSSSMFFSSNDQLKYDLAAQIASVLALVAGYGKDHIGLFLFSNDVIKMIPPKTGSNHIRRIMHALLSQNDLQHASKSTVVFDAIARMKKRDAIIFMVSDFLCNPDAKRLAVLARKHDVVAVRCLDRYEKEVPSVGALYCADERIKHPVPLFLQRGLRANSMETFMRERLAAQNQLFRRNAIDVLDMEPGKPFVGDLVRFFRKRMMY